MTTKRKSKIHRKSKKSMRKGKKSMRKSMKNKKITNRIKSMKGGDDYDFNFKFGGPERTPEEIAKNNEARKAYQKRQEQVNAIAKRMSATLQTTPTTIVPTTPKPLSTEEQKAQTAYETKRNEYVSGLKKTPTMNAKELFLARFGYRLGAPSTITNTNTKTEIKIPELSKKSSVSNIQAVFKRSPYNPKPKTGTSKH